VVSFKLNESEECAVIVLGCSFYDDCPDILSRRVCMSYSVMVWRSDSHQFRCYWQYCSVSWAYAVGQFQSDVMPALLTALEMWTKRGPFWFIARSTKRRL